MRPLANVVAWTLVATAFASPAVAGYDAAMMAQINQARAAAKAGLNSDAIRFMRSGLALTIATNGQDSTEAAGVYAELAQMLIVAKAYPEAIQLLGRTADIYRRISPGASPYVASAIEIYGTAIYQHSTDYPRAEIAQREALAMWKALLPNQRRAYARAASALADTLVERENFGGAEALYREALDINRTEYGAASPTTLQAADDLSKTLILLARFRDATTLLEATLAQRKTLIDPLAMAQTQAMLGPLVADAGDAQRGAVLLREAYDTYRKVLTDESAETINAGYALSRVLLLTGAAVEAEDISRRVTASGIKLYGAQSDEVRLLTSQLAGARTLLGRTAEAEAARIAAGAISDNIASPAAAITNLYTALAFSDPAQAEPILRASLATMQQYSAGKSAAARAAILPMFMLALASSLEDQGKDAASEALYRETVVLLESGIRIGTTDGVLALTGWGKRLFYSDREAEAVTVLRRADKAAADLGTSADIVRFGALAALGDALQYVQPDSPETLAVVRMMVTIADRHRDLAQSGADAGTDATARARARATSTGRTQASTFRPAYEAFVQEALRRGPRFPKENSALGAEAFLAAQGIVTSAAGDAMQATAIRQSLGESPLATKVRAQQQLAEEARALDTQLGEAVSNGEDAKAAALRTSIDANATALAAADKVLAADFPEYLALVSPRPLPLADVKARLRDDEGMLLLANGDDGVYAFGVSRDSLQWVRLGQSFDADVKALRCSIEEAGCDLPGTGILRRYDVALAAKLYRMLIQPVESAFAGKSRIFVTANGLLGDLPLAALVTSASTPGVPSDPVPPADTAWLGERYAFITLPSIAALRSLRRTPSRPVVKAQPFIGYGAPVLRPGDPSMRGAPPRTSGIAVDSSGLADVSALRRDFTALPGTERELAGLARVLNAPSGSVRIAWQATEAAVRGDARLADAKVIAFATHGLLPDPNRSLGIAEPGLVFSPPITASARDDGVLTASEAASLRLDADWVILSACNTGSIGAYSSSDSLSLLARAFIFAGGRAVLASHWRVSDDATEALSIETLTHARADPGTTPAQALQRAEHSIRTGRRADGSILKGWKPAWAHPLYWAPFTIAANADDILENNDKLLH